MKEERVPLSVSLIFSLMLPGLGHLLQGIVLPGLLWAFAVGASYLSFLPLGIVIHVGCLLDLAYGQRKAEGWESQKVGYFVLISTIIIFIAFYLVLRNDFF